MAARSLRRRVADITYRALRWGRDHVPPGVRTLVGVLFMVGGVFGFLPILGFWMLPLGAAFVALDIPLTRRRIDRWMHELEAERNGGAPAADVTPGRKPGA